MSTLNPALNRSDLIAPGWTDADIPNQSGRAAEVTGANSGPGLLTSFIAFHAQSKLANGWSVFEQKGYPRRVQPGAAGRDVAPPQRLWELSAERTAVYPAV